MRQIWEERMLGRQSRQSQMRFVRSRTGRALIAGYQ